MLVTVIATRICAYIDKILHLLKSKSVYTSCKTRLRRFEVMSSKNLGSGEYTRFQQMRGNVSISNFEMRIVVSLLLLRVAALSVREVARPKLSGLVTFQNHQRILDPAMALNSEECRNGCSGIRCTAACLSRVLEAAE